MGRNSNLTVPPGLSNQDRRFAEGIKENLDVILGHRGDPLERAVTFRDLLDAKIIQLAAGITAFGSVNDINPVVNDIPDLDIPPAPTGLSASGAFQNIILSWNLQLYRGHSIVEVFRHTSDSISSATLIAQVSGFTGVYADPVGPNADFYYWVRAVNQNGVTGPFNSSTGTRGQTSPDVDFLLATLTNAITSSELANSLSTPIGQIPGINTSISTINGNITTINGNITALDNFTGFSSSYSGDSLLTRMGAVETTANGAATSAQLQSEQTTRANADTALASDVTTLQSSVSTNAAAIQTEQTARANADSALSSDITSLTTTVSGNAAAISAETTARSNADSALASDITSLNTATSNNAAAITSEQTARANADSALATDITALNTATSNNAAAISSETTARTNADSAIANDVSTLQTAVSGNTTSISTQATSINGLSAQYTVKIDNNGAISGYGLASNAVDGAIVSEFIVNADRFAIMSPSTTLTNASGSHNASVPFIVQSSATTINGVSVPAGVYITDAFVRNGSIVNAKIANAAIDDAKIANLDASKISAGVINTSRLNIDGATLTADPNTGALQVADLAVTNAKIGNLAVTNAKIEDLAVSTLKIQDQAVTFPNAITTSANLAIASSSNNTTFATIQTLTGTYSGAPVLISGSFAVRSHDDQALMRFRLRRGSTVLFTSSSKAVRATPDLFIIPFNFLDTSTSSGSRTYTLQAYVQDQFGNYSDRTISTLEVKK